MWYNEINISKGSLHLQAVEKLFSKAAKQGADERRSSYEDYRNRQKHHSK